VGCEKRRKSSTHRSVEVRKNIVEKELKTAGAERAV
jgi:hypothetical protein